MGNYLLRMKISFELNTFIKNSIHGSWRRLVGTKSADYAFSEVSFLGLFFFFSGGCVPVLHELKADGCNHIPRYLICCVMDWAYCLSLQKQ